MNIAMKVIRKGLWTDANRMATTCRAQASGPLVVEGRVAVRVLGVSSA